MSYPIDIQAEGRAQALRLREICAQMNQSRLVHLIDQDTNMMTQLFVRKIQNGWVPKKGWATATKDQGALPSGPLSKQALTRTILDILNTLPDAELLGSLGIARARLASMRATMS